MFLVNNIRDYGRTRLATFRGTPVNANDPEVPNLRQTAARLSVVYNAPQGSGAAPEPPPAKKTSAEKSDEGLLQTMHENHLFRHIVWLLVLFAYSLLGGFIFSAIEGEHDRSERLQRYERAMDMYQRRRIYQQQIFFRFRDIESDTSFGNGNGNNHNSDAIKLSLVRDALSWYERKLGVQVDAPVMEGTHWNLWGGMYYAASLYTTIGYGDFAPKTTAGQVISMLYAFVGIPLVFTILLDWGFVFFTIIQSSWLRLLNRCCRRSFELEMRRRVNREQLRRVGSEISLRSLTTIPLLKITRTPAHDRQSSTQPHALRGQDLSLVEQERLMAVPMKAAFIFFVLWIAFSAFIVRLWETDWTYFTAVYYFFTTLTTIGLGDVVPKTPNYIVFNLALTLVGLSVVGLCIAIVQAKVEVVFNRITRSIESQYRVSQIEPVVSGMALLANEKEGLKRIWQGQPLEDRLLHYIMDEHKKRMLEQLWLKRSQMANKATQTTGMRQDKSVQTGMKSENPLQKTASDGDLPPTIGTGDEPSSSRYEEDELDEEGVKIIPRSTKKYIYCIFD